jgi:hypothetical protein
VSRSSSSDSEDGDDEAPQAKLGLPCVPSELVTQVRKRLTKLAAEHKVMKLPLPHDGERL